MAVRTIPATATKSSGQLITGALWNAGPKAAGDFLLNPPIFRGRQATTQNLSDSIVSVLNLDVTDVDSDSGHSNVTNNSRYTCQVPGWYWVEGFLSLNSGGSASRIGTFIYKNGFIVTGSYSLLNRQSDLQALSAATLVQLAVGDYVETAGYQTSGATLSTFDGTDICPSMNVFWVSK